MAVVSRGQSCLLRALSASDIVCIPLIQMIGVDHAAKSEKSLLSNA